MRDDKDSDERYQIDKNDEERVTNDIEVLKLGKFGSQKNTDNVEKESDERNRMDVIDGKEYDERYQMVESKEDNLESEQSETDEKDRIKIQNHLRGLISNIIERMMILLIRILSWRQMW